MVSISLAMLAMSAVPASAQGPDEVERFFAHDRGELRDEQRQRIRTLVRKVQVGEKYDRLTARRELLVFGRAAIPMLLDDLLSNNAEDGRNAALLVGRIGDQHVASALREALFTKGRISVDVRHGAMALGRIGTAADVEPLIALLGRTKRHEQRRAILYAIGWLADESAIDSLAPLWDRERSQDQRAALLLAVGRIGGSKAFERIIRQGISNKKELIRRAATVALADLEDPARVPALIQLLRDGDGDVVRHALIGLTLLRDERITPAVRKVLHRDADEEVRALAMLALAPQRETAAWETLAARLGPRVREHRSVRATLAFAMARRPEPGAGTILEALLGDADEEVAAAALCAIAIRSQGGLLLPSILADQRFDDVVRLAALDLIAYRSPLQAAPLLRKMIQVGEEKKKILERAQRLLEEMGSDPTRSSPVVRARVQVLVDDLGGSPEWQLLKAVHRQMLALEHLDRSLTGTSAGGVRPNGSPRPPDRWTREEEDMRIWYDLFPYFDRRERLDVP